MPTRYFDHQSTTPVDPRVLEVMRPYFDQHYGNSASRTHEFGWRAEAAVEQARARVARLIGASSKEIVFTSGATESNNLALIGAMEFYKDKGRHLIITATEHSSVLEPAQVLEEQGFELTILPVDRYGRVSAAAVAAAIRPETVLVSVIFGNNEIGTLNPIAEIGQICREKKVLFHTDAVQAAAHLEIDVEKMSVDLLSLSAHKLYGPKGIGALYIRARKPRVQLKPLLYGGGHERGLRPGTLNVPAIVGFGVACDLALQARGDEAKRLSALANQLWMQISSELPDVLLNGHPLERVPGNLNVTVPGVLADTLMIQIKDIALSSGSACSSARAEPSHVLRAIGYLESDARMSVRFGVGRSTTAADVEYCARRVVETVREIRDVLTPLHVAQDNAKKR